MELKQAIHARHAVRSYRRQKVDERDLRALLEAAVRAPNAKNEQPWSFVIVQNRSMLERYSEQAKKRLLAAADECDASARALLRGSFDPLHGACTLIVICGRKGDEFAEADCWLAAENLMLTACDLGLGTCPVGSLLPVLNSWTVKAELDIPEAVAAIAPVVVGYPDGPTVSPTPRSAPRIWSFWR